MAKLMQASLCSFGLNAAFGEVGLCVAYGFFAALNDYKRCSGEQGLGVPVTGYRLQVTGYCLLLTVYCLPFTVERMGKATANVKIGRVFWK